MLLLVIARKRFTKLFTTKLLPIVSCLLAIAIFAVVGSSDSIAQVRSPANPASQSSLPSQATQALTANFKVTVSNQSLRELIDSVQASAKLPVVLDRRIDPSALAIPKQLSPANNTANEPFDPTREPPLKPVTLGPTLRELLDQIAEARQLKWIASDTIVLFGKNAAVDVAATELLAAKQKLGLPSSDFPRRVVQWPRLTTPEEALKIVADTWQLNIDDIGLPHDLWPAVDLATTDVATALMAISFHFDQVFDLDPLTRRVHARPLDPQVTFTKLYPYADLPSAKRSAIFSSRSENSPAVQLTRQSDRWQLKGNARSHLELELALFVRKRPTAGRTKAEPRYTLKFAGIIGEGLAGVCQQSNLQLDVSQLSPDQLSRRVEFEAKDQTIQQLLEEFARLGDFEIELTETQVVAKPH